MNKKYLIIFLILFAAILIFLFLDNQNKKEKINHYKDQLSNKYNIEKNDLEFKKLVKKHKETSGEGVWIDAEDSVVPDYIQFTYNDKTITILGDYDDYLYDELVEKTNDYFKEILNYNDLIVLPKHKNIDNIYETSKYADYLMKNNIDTITEENVNNFILNNNITIYISTTNITEDTIKEIIDKLNNLNYDVTIELYNSITMETYRSKPNFYYLDYYYLKGIEQDKKISIIAKDCGTTCNTYNNYGYTWNT